MAAAADITPSRILEIAVEKYLGIQTDDAPLNRLNSMEQAIDQLRQQSEEFERAIVELREFREKLRCRGF